MKRFVIWAGTALLLPSLSCSWHDERPQIERTAPGAQLVEEALCVLELVERGQFDASAQRIGGLRPRFGADGSVAVLERLLGAWAETRRHAAAPEPSPSASAPVAVEFPPAPLEEPRPSGGASGEAEPCKQKGILLYSQGNLEEALRCWRQALELDPGDTEARQLIGRAETILAKRKKQSH